MQRPQAEMHAVAEEMSRAELAGARMRQAAASIVGLVPLGAAWTAVYTV